MSLSLFVHCHMTTRLFSWPLLQTCCFFMFKNSCLRSFLQSYVSALEGMWSSPHSVRNKLFPLNTIYAAHSASSSTSHYTSYVITYSLIEWPTSTQSLNVTNIEDTPTFVCYMQLLLDQRLEDQRPGCIVFREVKLRLGIRWHLGHRSSDGWIRGPLALKSDDT